MSIERDSFKFIQDAWVRMLLDFRAWFYPETPQMVEWKRRDIMQAIRACRASMVDDTEEMLASYRKNVNKDDKLTSAFMPVMLTATAVVDQPPSVSQLLTVPYFIDGMIDGKNIRIRTVGSAVRAQIAFFATNPHDARSVCEQFCAYMTDDFRRKIKISYDLGGGYSDEYPAMVLENELFPSPVPHEQKNLSIFTVDVTLICTVPHVLGLNGLTDVDNGFDESGIPKHGDGINGEVVTHAYNHESDTNDSYEVVANKDTGESTVSVSGGLDG